MTFVISSVKTEHRAQGSGLRAQSNKFALDAFDFWAKVGEEGNFGEFG
jgi:hypothetical protein